jgi:hypothetical protein
MAPKSEYGSTPDVEKGGSDEDKPQKWWCFHATRRVMRTILVLIPLLALTAFDVYALVESTTSHTSHESFDKDYIGKMAKHAFISFWTFVALLIWIPTVWLLIGWAEPFPKYLQIWVLALLVYLPVMYHYEMECMNNYFSSLCYAFKEQELDCSSCTLSQYDYLAHHTFYPECSKNALTAKNLMLFFIRKRKHAVDVCRPAPGSTAVFPCTMMR